MREGEMAYHPLRRSDREITDAETIDRILREGKFAVIALNDGLEPYVVTLSYGHDASANRLYFHVAHAGRKLDIIAKNPKGCATIVLDHGYTQGECEHPFESVVLFGEMRVVTDPDEKLHAIETLVGHLEADAAGYWSSRTWALDQRINGFTALSFDVAHMTAKQGK